MAAVPNSFVNERLFMRSYFKHEHKVSPATLLLNKGEMK